MKTNELTGALLDYWVARAEGKDGQIVKSTSPCNLDYFELKSGTPFRPSTHWAHGGPLVEKYGLNTSASYSGVDEPCGSAAWSHDLDLDYGDTLLVAICRAVVRGKFGAELPDDQRAES